MCKAIDEMRLEAWAEGFAEEYAKNTGKGRVEVRLAVIKALMEKKGLTLQDAMRVSGMPMNGWESLTPKLVERRTVGFKL